MAKYMVMIETSDDIDFKNCDAFLEIRLYPRLDDREFKIKKKLDITNKIEWKNAKVVNVILEKEK